MRLVAMNIDPTQPFPREAEPKPETLGEIADLVRAKGCDVGFAQDPGRRPPGRYRRARARPGQRRCPGARRRRRAFERLDGDVVVNLTTSSAIDDIAQQFGRKVYRTPVGEANVVEMIQAVKAAIGGEGSSGGIIFPAVHLCRDSYSGMALFLHRMASTGLTMSELAGRLPKYYRKIGKVGYEHGRLGYPDAATRRRFPDAQMDRTDGLKLMWPDRWVHVRSSNTEPLLRFATEAKSEEAMEGLYTAG